MRADHSDIEHLSTELLLASDALAQMTGQVAKARQIREYDSDRRKRALALAVQDVLGHTPEAANAAAEHKARASQSYQAAMGQLGAELREAEKMVAQWEASKARFEALRSLLSVQKNIVANL